MKIKLKNKPEHIELIKAMGSKDAATASKAQEAFAALVGPVVQRLLDLASMSKAIYVDWPYAEDDQPSFPLDQFYSENFDHVTVWQQNIAGGLGSSLVTGLQELLIQPYELHTAVSLLKKNVRKGRLPYVSLALNRMANELRRKQERNAWLVVLMALGQASTNGLTHTIAATTANVLQLDDFNRLLTRTRRINTAFDGRGTPSEAYSRGATNMFMSPEMMQEIRGFAYNAMNRTAFPNSDESTAIPLPDNIREEIYNSAGASEIYGVTISEMLELGTSRVYNNIFSTYAQAGIAPGGGNFGATADECIVAVDATKEAIIRPVATDAETGAEFVASPDDQFPSRSEKIGFWGSLEESRLCVDSRSLTGLIV